MNKKYSLIVVLIAFVVGFFASNIFDNYKIIKKSDEQTNNYIATEKQSESSSKKENKYSEHQSEKQYQQQGNIPAKIFPVIEYIKKYKTAPENYVGGRKFMNYEKLLPQDNEDGNKINYQEWDVNPKIEGKNRGTERLVTGSDGKIYYTNDHYKSFTEVKY